jgi:predicted dehydrogenase
MAEAHAKVLLALGVAFEVVGRGAQSATRFATAIGVRPHEGGLAAFLAKRSLSADMRVIVALPIPQLAGAIRQLVAAGARHLLVEKPAGLDLEDIDGAAAVAASARAEIFVAYNRRFYSSVSAARAIIAEDGGISSFHVEFTELAARVATPDKDPAVLANWFLANSSHVLDLAFHIAGPPADMSGAVAGSLPWHPAGAVFAGHGCTAGGALFTWHADWASAGRWGLDLRTPKRRLLLQPLESLFVQDAGSFGLREIAAGDALDRDYKPGIYRQLDAFLSPHPASRGLPTIAQHASNVRQCFLPILRPSSGERIRAIAH